ncbi:MAG: EpsG family protein [Hungatella hathewayi]|uniref:EpsG family protein n=1 Tax=Hungatella TaxID=1649459 RepID=UPI0011068396|nr:MULTISPECIES: EpsG family protein [Hungatella]MCI7381402.1 EpsG family protein [Hungatella sp.]MDY6239838.1 EpsG family protein [Hungatella hathewayi]
MGYILIGIYVLLVLYHLVKDINGDVKWAMVYITFGFLFYLCSHCEYLNTYDLSNYNAQYAYYNPMWDKSFTLYYLFLTMMRLGQIAEISFVNWWWITLAGAFLIIIIAVKIHRFNPHHFLVFFMMYYIINLYTGLKFFYGFCIYLLASGFLLRGGRKNKLLYIFLTAVAGGMHVMYYAFILFALINTDVPASMEECSLNIYSHIRRHRIIAVLVIASLTLSFVLRLSGSANEFLSRIFSIIDFDKMDDYLSLSTKGGFYIPVIMQLLSLYLAFIIKKQSKRTSLLNQQYTDVLYYFNLLQVIFYPLFMISTTFMRLITATSMVTIAAGGYDKFEFKQRKRFKITGASFLIVAASLFRQLVLGHWWETAVVPLFHL